jgi:hypothetical protein
MTHQEFEEILLKPESNILDFKREQYDILNKSNEANLAKFIKDIISFCNTIKTESAFIILGVGENENGEKELIGINKHIDDSVFQEKIKDKVTPIPYFNYSTIKFGNKIFGIIEIPVRKYEEPIFPTVKMKGLESGKVYCRRSSSNSEATGREIIQIYNWLESIPSQSFGTDISEEISEIISKATAKLLPLSEQIAASLRLAKKYKLDKLERFCVGELSGWYHTEDLDVESELSYRLHKVIVTTSKIEMNPFSFQSLTSQQMLDEIKRIDNDATEIRFLFPHSITDVESFLTRFSTNNNSLITLTLNADKLFDNQRLEGIKIKAFATEHIFGTIYQGIRQKLINNLLHLK